MIHQQAWHKKIQWIIPPIFITFITALVYYPSRNYPFQFDDIANIAKFFDIRHKSFSDFFFTGTRWISYWLNTLYYKINQFNPYAFRLSNIASHIVLGLIIFAVVALLLRRLSHDHFLYRHRLYIAFLTAGLFLLHPVQTQTVSYVIQGQLEGLAALSMFMMVLLFLLHVSPYGRLVRTVSLVLLYGVAILSSGTKEIAIISPILLILIDWFFVAQGNWSALQRRWYVHGAVALIVWGFYLYFMKPSYFTQIFGLQLEIKNNVGNMLTNSHDEAITPWAFARSQFKVMLHYIWIFLYPWAMSVDYDWFIVRNFLHFDCIVPFMLLLALASYTLYRLNRDKTDWLAFAIIWFFVAVLPRSSIIPSSELLMDYKTYTASFGIFLILSVAIMYVLERLLAHRPWWVFYGVIMLFLSMLGYLSFVRNKVWGSAQEFWLDIVQHAPKKARSHNNYGVALSEAHKFQEAIDSFERAIAMDPLYPDPYVNVATAYGALNRVDDAIEVLKQAILLQPYYPESYNNIAAHYMTKKNFYEAERYLKRAIMLRPHYGKAYFNLGRLYIETGHKDKAWECYKNCCTRADFDNEVGFRAYGLMSLMLHKFEDAAFAYEQLMLLNPRDTDYIFNAACAQHLMQHEERAQVLIDLLVMRAPHDKRAHFLYGEIMYAQERYEDAMGWYEKTVALDPHFLDVRFKGAECLDKMGKCEQARIWLREFIAMDPPAEHKKRAEKMLTLFEKKR